MTQLAIDPGHLIAAKENADLSRDRLLAALREANAVEAIVVLPLINEAANLSQKIAALVLALEDRQ